MIPVTDGVWLDNDGRHDTRSGGDVVTPLTAAEQVTVLRAAIDAGIADLEAAQQVAATDTTDAEGRAAQAQALAATAASRATTVTAWTPQTAATATTIAALQAKVLADLQAVRSEVAALHDRDRLILAALAELYTARALHSRGIALAYRCLVGLARIVGGRLT